MFHISGGFTTLTMAARQMTVMDINMKAPEEKDYVESTNRLVEMLRQFKTRAKYLDFLSSVTGNNIPNNYNYALLDDLQNTARTHNFTRLGEMYSYDSLATIAKKKTKRAIHNQFGRT